MSDVFDPYYKWLAIPPEDQPPDYYRLLGVKRFEEDGDVIQTAADRQMAHVRTYQTGGHSAVSQRILNELSVAKIHLLNKVKKAAYDVQLRAARSHAESEGEASDEKGLEGFPQIAVKELQPPTPREQKATPLPLPYLMGGAVLVVVMLAGGWLVWGGGAAGEGKANADTRQGQTFPEVADPSEYGFSSTGRTKTSGKKTAPSAPVTVADVFTPFADEKNSLGMKMVLLPAGQFQMGSPDGEDKRKADEGPQHAVQLSRGFYLSAYEVTQQEYQTLMGENPAAHAAQGDRRELVQGLKTERFPVERVSWEEAVEFCRRLTAAEAKLGHRYRLPTEAEWEYACRAGTKTPFSMGADCSSLQANFKGTSPYGRAATGPSLGRPAAVGSYEPNAWGLYDMHGNVGEWCADFYGEEYYVAAGAVNPVGPISGEKRVVRGGTFSNAGTTCRSASRSSAPPGSHFLYIGFRVVCEVH